VSTLYGREGGGGGGVEPGPRGADNPRGARRSFYVDMVLFPDVRDPAASLLKSFTPVGTVRGRSWR